MDDMKTTVNGLSSTVCFADVVAQVESLRGRMGAPQSTRQALGRLPDRACRDLVGLFESLLAESSGG